jgi:hypothetical protein
MAEVIARRSTFDGKPILLWSDGDLTFSLGRGIPKLRIPRGSSTLALAAGWLVLGEVELYEAAEVAALAKAALESSRRGESPGEFRARAGRMLTKGSRRRTAGSGAGAASAGGKRGGGAGKGGLVPRWEVLEADRDGKPRLRVWRLPRIFYAGLAVWHERGVYEIMEEARRGSGTYRPTGFRRKTLREIMDLLPALQEHSEGRRMGEP